MKNRQLLLGILVMILIFGMAGFVYANPIDRSLNGTWDNNDRDSGYIFNNGVFQFFINNFITMRGTYTTNSGRINMTVTDIHGAMFDLENRFYTIRELQSASLQSWQRGELRQMIEHGRGSYSVIGNRLTIFFDIEEMGIEHFIRR